MKSKTIHSLIVCLILTVGYLTSVTAVTDAELEALEKQIEQQEAEEKQQAEEKIKAEAKRKAEQKRKTEAEAKRKAEAEAEKKRLAEMKAKRKAEEERLEEIERKRKEQRLAEEKAEAMARDEALQAKQLLHESFVGYWKLTNRCSWGSSTDTFAITSLGTNGDLSFSGDAGNKKYKEGYVNNDSIRFITSNLLNTVKYSGKIISQTRMEGTYTQGLSSETCDWDATK